MAELTFVLKCFVLSCVAVFVLQYKIAGRSLETTVYATLHNSRVAGWLQDMGMGAVRLTASGYDTAASSTTFKGMLPVGLWGSVKDATAFRTTEHHEETPAKDSQESSTFPEEAP